MFYVQSASGQHGSQPSGQHSSHDVLTDESVCSATKNVVGSFGGEDSVQSSVTADHCSQPQAMSSSSANELALSTASASNHLSAQYSQFLASVRDFKPLVSDLNASIASVASSVTTMQAGLNGHIADGSSQHYVSDAVIHSPISQPQPSLTHAGYYQHSHVTQHDSIKSQHHGKHAYYILVNKNVR